MIITNLYLKEFVCVYALLLIAEFRILNWKNYHCWVLGINALKYEGDLTACSKEKHLYWYWNYEICKSWIYSVFNTLNTRVMHVIQLLLQYVHRACTAITVLALQSQFTGKGPGSSKAESDNNNNNNICLKSNIQTSSVDCAPL